MKVDGLLTAEEARACVKAGYEDPWTIWLSEPTRPPQHETFPRLGVLALGLGLRGGDCWCVHTPDGGDLIPFDAPFGLSPLDGYWLPMEAAPKDWFRPFQALFSKAAYGKTYASRIVTAERNIDGGDSFYVPALDNHFPWDFFVGWRPIIEIEEGA